MISSLFTLILVGCGGGGGAVAAATACSVCCHI